MATLPLTHGRVSSISVFFPGVSTFTGVQEAAMSAELSVGTCTVESSGMFRGIQASPAFV